MLSFLRRIFTPGRAESGDRTERAAKIQLILRAELSRTSVQGKPVTHRRLLSLMEAARAGRSETIRHLREIGARPSTRLGGKVWTLNE